MTPELDAVARETRVIVSYLELRKRGACETILADSGVFYRCESQLDPWGTRRRISLGEFEAIVSRAEGVACAIAG